MKVFEIGSEYDWDSNKNLVKLEGNAIEFNCGIDTLKFFRSGRDALRYIAKALRKYIDTVKNISTMNCQSTETLKHIDLKRMYTIRLKHCRTFFDELSSLDNIRLLGSEAVKSTLYFPVLVKAQSIVQKKLAEKGIYAPVIWPLPKLAEGVCEIADDVAAHMLGIPCDHRYTVQLV